MIVAVDVQYGETRGYAAGVTFGDWTQPHSDREVCIVIDEIAEYVPGHFYKRELPCILKILGQLDRTPDIIVIDGYVYLTSKNQPGLGAHLYDALNRKVPVIGVAKTSFSDTPTQTQVFRGGSKKPLFVTTAGYDPDLAKEHIVAMSGNYRIPALLRQVDQLSRKLAKLQEKTNVSTSDTSM